MRKYRAVLGDCEVAVLGTAQPPRKSIPAIVLNLERSVGGICVYFFYYLSLSLSLSSLSYMLFGAYTFSLNTHNSLSTFPYLSRNVQGQLEK